MGWMTCDDVKDDFDRFSATDVYDMAKAGWYREIPYAKVAECARSLYTEVFPESEAVTKRRYIDCFFCRICSMNMSVYSIWTAISL